MGSRRPMQMDLASIISMYPKKPPFAESKISGLKTDPEGNVTHVTVVGPLSPAYPESEDTDPWWDQPAPEGERR